VRTYGQAGYKAAPFLCHQTLTAFAENAKLDNMSSFVDAALQLENSHYQYYAQEIWQFGSNEADRDRMWPLGMKILRKILNPVMGISLEEPHLDSIAYQNLSDLLDKEEYKEWEKVPKLPVLVTLCSIHAITSSLPQEEIAQEFILSEN
jgi:hypothetical protein